jgi:hypothetical protein
VLKRQIAMLSEHVRNMWNQSQAFVEQTRWREAPHG